MGIEKVLEFSFGLFRKDIKVALPNVLNLVPSALFSLILLQAASAIGSLINVTSIDTIFTNQTLFMQIIKTGLTYALILIPVLVLSMLVSVFLSGVYADITRQAYKNRKQNYSVSLTQAFATGSQKFIPLLWTYFIEFVISIAVFAGLVGLGFLGGIVGIIASALIAVIILLVMFVFFYLTPAAVVLENRSGMDAIGRSYEIAKSNFWSLIIIIFIAGIIMSTVVNGLTSIPYAGIILSNLALLFLNAWNYMIPNSFYFEYGRKKVEV